MKLLILTAIVIVPTLLVAQGIPDTGNSKLWEMRKKMQQRSTQRVGSYLEQMNQSLASGDASGAESALKAAIAQGTMTQPQIDESRGRMDAMVSQQRQAMVAEARAREAAAAREADQHRASDLARASREAMDRRTVAESPVSPATPAGRGPAAKESETELSRFKARWKGRTANFTVTWDDGGSFLNGTHLEVADPDTGKKFQVHYNVGLNKGIFDADTKSAVGATVSIRFGADGMPASIKNPTTGRGANISGKVTGYGW